MDRDLIPPTYQLLRVAVPDDIVVEAIGPELPQDWRTQTMVCRDIGDRWLDRSASALLQVPSAISVRGANFLLNPTHLDAARVSVAEVIQAPFDPRLLA
ncbi:RES domain-containing protein [Bradyrhizobium sp. YR681]|nr:RES domain-containing protein [Bradyrhizobium sp. YR681]